MFYKDPINRITFINDHFQNYKQYNIQKAQLLIADIPYNISNNAYASSPQWYIDGSIENGESHKAGKNFFDTDEKFNISEFLHFCTKLIKPEPKEKGKSPCMIIFCEFEQQFEIIEKAKKFGLNNYINLVFRKNYSAQVLKANMRIVGNSEYAIILFRERLPYFNNEGRMIFNTMDYFRDNTTPKIHPTQKSIHNLKQLIRLFTDKNDVVIDPVAGSGTTLLAAAELNRISYGFEIKKNFYNQAINTVLSKVQKEIDFEITDNSKQEKIFVN